MLKKIWLPIVVGFSAGAIVAGSVLLAVFVVRGQSNETVLASNKTDPSNKYAEIQEVGSLKLVEMAAYNKDSVAPALIYPLQLKPANSENAITPWMLLQDKIKRRLNNGPEMGMLKAVYFQYDIPNSREDYGFYVGSTNEIFINTFNAIDRMKRFGLLSVNSLNQVVIPSNGYENLAEILAEHIFQTLYHEYGHHMAYVYLNSDNRHDSIEPAMLYRRDSAQADTEWDAKFLNTFKTALGYDSAQLTNFKPPVTRFSASNFESLDARYRALDNSIVLPLSNLYSLKDLFDRANTDFKVTKVINGFSRLVSATTDEAYAELTSRVGYSYTTYASTENPLTKVSPPVLGDDLAYYYLMDEIYTRKMQQATMPLDTVPSGAIGYYSDGTIHTQNGIQIGNFLYDALHYVDKIDDTRATAPAVPFYSDYLYKKFVDANQTYSFDSRNAQTIYDAMLERMGYASGADLSVLWFENSSDYRPEKNNTTIPDSTWKMKFGGYLSEAQKDFKYVGYFDGSGFVSVPITVSAFNFRMKERLNSFTGLPLDAKKDNYFYQTSKYFDVLDGGWFDKQLYFAQDIEGKTVQAFQTYNNLASTDVGGWNKDDNGSYYSFAKNSVAPIKFGETGVALRRNSG